MRNADHKNVDRRLREVPLGSVEHQHVGRLLGQEADQQRRQCRVVEVVARKKAANPAVVGGLFYARLQRHSDPAQIGGGELQGA